MVKTEKITKLKPACRNSSGRGAFFFPPGFAVIMRRLR
jgi:hypothetical protein